MKSLTNREFAKKLTDFIYDVREDYRECYNKTDLELVCEDLADEVRQSLSYSVKEYSLVNSYLDKIEELERDRDNELNCVHDYFMENFLNCINYECLYEMMYDLKDPAGNYIFNFNDEEFNFEVELEEIMSCPNNCAYELVKDQLDNYFCEVYISEEAYEWGETHEYYLLSWACEVLNDYIYLLSPEEREFMKNMRERGDK